MDKKLHEDLNRIRKLSGLNEQTVSHIEKLPGIDREWSYTDRPRGGRSSGAVGDGQFRDFGDPGPGTSTSGNGGGAGEYGNSQGSSNQGNRYSQGVNGTTQGSSTGNGSYNGVTGDGQHYNVTPGTGGNVSRIQRTDPGSTGFRAGPGLGDNPNADWDGRGSGYQRAEPGLQGGYDDGDIDSDYIPTERPETSRERSQRLKQEKQQAAQDAAEQRRQDKLDRSQQNQKVTNPPNTGYVNPAWEKEQERIRQQQQTPPKPTPAQDLILKDPAASKPITFPTAKTTTTPPPEPAKKPADDLPKLTAPAQPKVTFPVAKAEPTPEPVKKQDDLPKLKTNEPKITFPVAKAEPTPEPAKKPAADLPILKANEPKITFPSVLPSTPKEPESNVKQFPSVLAPEPNKEITSHPVPPTTVSAQTDSKPVIDPSSDTIKIPTVLTTKEPSTWDVPPAGEYKPGTSTPVTPSTAEPSSEPKASVSVAPSNADNTADVELLPMSQADQEKMFGPMPGQTSSTPPPPTPAKKGDNGGGKVGSGSPGSSASGGSEPGASGEKGASSDQKAPEPWTRPLVLKPGETPPGKFDSPGRIGAPDFKGTLTNPGTLSNPVPGMPDTDLTGKVNSTSNSTPAGSGGNGNTLQTGSDPSVKDGTPSLTIKGPGNKSEGMERMLQLAGIKESTKVERQFLQESTVSKTNSITDTIKRLAGLQ